MQKQGGNMGKKLIELSNIPNIEILIDTKWLLKKAMKQNMNASDIMIRLLAIDNFYEKNDYGFELYNKMQKTRVSKIKEIPHRMKEYEEDFKVLIKSFEERGYDSSYPVDLNQNFEVFDGAHRLALAIYFNIEKIPVRFSEKYIDKEYDYSVQWFNENGLEDLVPFIMSKYNDIMK